MATSLQEAATKVLDALSRAPRNEVGRADVDGKFLANATDLTPAELNDAISLLVRSGYAEWRQYLGTAPFIFGHVTITPVGRYENERANAVIPEALKYVDRAQAGPTEERTVRLPPTPIGSPYGFTDQDWEHIAERKDRSDQLIVVLGFQFASSHYDSAVLRTNVERMFRDAVNTYNATLAPVPTVLVFQPLAAGYGEHLFNEIARDIIASDIAVFDTSDLNPNVMVELGVALTWGIRVLMIKRDGQPKPPSDISGQTWADYEDSAGVFLDPEHQNKLVRMVERAMRKKGRR